MQPIAKIPGLSRSLPPVSQNVQSRQSLGLNQSQRVDVNRYPGLICPKAQFVKRFSRRVRPNSALPRPRRCLPAAKFFPEREIVSAQIQAIHPRPTAQNSGGFRPF